MRVLVDTSVWVAHFRQGDPVLVDLLERDAVLCHPMVVLEIACGTPPSPRRATLDYLAQLPGAYLATSAEVLALIERHQLYGEGCGMVDLSLLASALMTPGATLWTLDRRLLALALQLGVAAKLDPKSH